MKNRGARLAFDRFVIDVGKRRLLCDGRDVPLNGKTFDLLLVLAARCGEVLSREEIYRLLWPGTAVEDGNLSQHVYLLRRALDTGARERYIQTLPRYGYRFNACVREEMPVQRTRAALWRYAAGLTCALVLAAGSSPPAGPPLPAPAREAYVLGMYHLNLRSAPDLRYALRYFTKVASQAPASAPGYAGISAAHALLAEFSKDGSASQEREVSLARRFRDAALARDRTNSDALAIAGFIAYRFDDNLSQAEHLLLNAIESDPYNAAAHHWHGVYLLAAGNLPRALAEFETAHRLEPTSEVYSRWLARAYTYAGRPGDAIAMTTQTLQIRPGDAPAWLALACAQEQQGRLREALRTLKTLAEREPDEQRYVASDEARLQLRIDHGAGGKRVVAFVDGLAATGRVDPFETALFYFTAGMKARGLEALASAPHSRIALALERYDARLKPFREVAGAFTTPR